MGQAPAGGMGAERAPASNQPQWLAWSQEGRRNSAGLTLDSIGVAPESVGA